jgi:hypothetical protein
VKKTVVKTVYTLAIGPIHAHETILQCGACDNKDVYRSGNLQQIVPFRCSYGYDVLVYAGTKMFLQSWDIAQIQKTLEFRGIPISSSEIAYLAKKFIVYLAQIHRESTESIKGHMNLNGGYILHIDGTMEADSPVLMSVIDGISGFVLDNIKVPSERSKELILFLKRIKGDYGIPVALVHDMGLGILKAVKTVFPGVPDFICHYHFLRDIGKDLLDKEYDIIRKRLKNHGVQSYLNNLSSTVKDVVESNTSTIHAFVKKMQGQNNSGGIMTEGMASISAFALIKWILEGKKQGKGYGYPFDRPLLTLFHRLKKAYATVDTLRYEKFEGNPREQRLFGKLWRKIGEVVSDKELNNAVRMMEKKADVFDKLRKAMQITDPNGKAGLNDSGKISASTIESNVKAFSSWLDGEGDEYKGMKNQINKYWEKLFSDPIIVDAQQGKISIQPQRTNNIMEQFFRDYRRSNRKKTGFDSLTKTLKTMIADTPLVKNLENDKYIKIILKGKASLEERFAEIDPQLIKDQLTEAQKKLRKMPEGIAKLIKIPNFSQKLIETIQSYR